MEKKLYNYEGFKYYKGEGTYKYSLVDPRSFVFDRNDIVSLLDPIKVRDITSDYTYSIYNRAGEEIFKIQYKTSERVLIGMVITITPEFKWDGLTCYADYDFLLEASLIHDVLLQLIHDFKYFQKSNRSINCSHDIFLRQAIITILNGKDKPTFKEKWHTVFTYLGLRLLHRPWAYISRFA